MGADTVVALVASGLAAVIAVTVPYMTFRLALRQDHIRWLRERRADLYVDILAEAYAEQQWINYDMADDETRERMRSYYVDMRLSPLERARLAARSNLYGSRRVNQLANGVEAAYGPAGLRRLNEGERTVVRVKVAGAFEELQAAIRAEMGVNDPRLDPANPG